MEGGKEKGKKSPRQALIQLLQEEIQAGYFSPLAKTYVSIGHKKRKDSKKKKKEKRISVPDKYSQDDSDCLPGEFWCGDFKLTNPLLVLWNPQAWATSF